MPVATLRDCCCSDIDGACSRFLDYIPHTTYIRIVRAHAFYEECVLACMHGDTHYYTSRIHKKRCRLQIHRFSSVRVGSLQYLQLPFVFHPSMRKILIFVHILVHTFNRKPQYDTTGRFAENDVVIDFHIIATPHTPAPPSGIRQPVVPLLLRLVGRRRAGQERREQPRSKIVFRVPPPFVPGLFRLAYLSPSHGRYLSEPLNTNSIGSHYKPPFRVR